MRLSKKQAEALQREELAAHLRREVLLMSELALAWWQVHPEEFRVFCRELKERPIRMRRAERAADRVSGRRQ